MWNIDTHRAEETYALGLRLAQGLQQPLVIALVGDLGSGKTCFTQGLAEGLDVQEPVTSPTFVLIQEYEGRLPLFHADLYRLEEKDLEPIGIEEQIETWPGLVVVEWADRFSDVVPADHLRIEICDLGGDRRRISFVPRGSRSASLLTGLQIEILES